jgi:hypothetical protein
MKKINLFLICIQLLLVLFTKAQITLEHTYSNAGAATALTYTYISPVGPTTSNIRVTVRFYMVNLEISGPKYVAVDLQNQSITFYNLNHTLYKNISFAGVTILSGNQAGMFGIPGQKNNADILYISESLFDTDPEIEFLYSFNANSTLNTSITHVVNENGAILFTANGEAPLVRPNFHNQYYPIYNTPLGTKMILSKSDSTAKVYSLGGTLTTAIGTNHVLSENSLFNLSPNPAFMGQNIAITYELPESIESADLFIMDQAGKEINSFKIGNHMNHILIDSKTLPSGTYFYSIQSGGKVLGTKKSIVIN